MWSEFFGVWFFVSGVGFKYSRVFREVVGFWDGEFKRNVKERFVTDELFVIVFWDGLFKNSRNFFKVFVIFGVYFGIKFDVRDMRVCGIFVE